MKTIGKQTATRATQGNTTMNIPSESNTEAYGTYLAEMMVVFGTIDEMESHAGDMTFGGNPARILTDAEQALENRLFELNDNYSRATDAFCAKYELTEDERDYNFCN